MSARIAATAARLLVAAAACGALLELLLRVFFPLPPGASVKVRDQTLPGLTREVVYERNALGLRSLSMRRAAKPPGGVRVLALGASTTDSPTQNAEDAWWGLLEVALRARFPGVPIEVAAFGRGGATVVHRLAWARRWLPVLDPDVVVTLEGVNDLAWHGDADYRYDGLEAAVAAVKLEAHASCSDWSQICRRLDAVKRRRRLASARRAGHTLEWHSANLAKRTAEYRALPRVAAPERPVDPIVEFGDAFGALLELLRERGIATVVMTQPVLWKPGMSEAEHDRLWFAVHTPAGPVQPDPAWLAAEMGRYNALQRRLAAGVGASVVDLAGELPSDTANLFDDCHFTDAGSRRVAELLTPAVAKQVAAVLARRAAAGRG